MPAPLSIIIPAKEASADLPGCLSALYLGVDAGLVREVIVSAVTSCDTRLREIAEEAGAVFIEGGEGRGTQMRHGADTARGEWLLFIHADTWLSRGWTETVLAHIADKPDKAGAFRLAFRSPARQARIVEALTNWRARTFGLPYGDQGLLISRSLYEDIGGFDAVPLMEDVMIVRRIGKARLVELAARAATSGEKQEREGWFLRSLQNLWFLFRFSRGASPEKLAKAYYSK